jgi:long-subunit fatty acid transport protein
LAVALALTAGQAFGSAFALQEQNASGLGHASRVAAAEDVSTIFTTRPVWSAWRPPR